MNEKTCILTSSFPRYEGDPVSPFLYELCKHLVKIGHEVHVIAPHYPGTSIFQKMEGIYVHRFVYFRPKRLQILAYGDRIPSNIEKSHLAKLLVPFYILSLLKKTLKVVREFRIDVITAFWAIPQGVVALLVKKITRRPLITRIFPVELALTKSKYMLFQPLLKAVIIKSDFVVPNSNYTLRRLVELNFSPKRVKVIPPGVDSSRFKWKRASSQYFDRYGIKKDEEVLLSVGRLVERKGFEYLIQAIPFLRKSFPYMKLLIVGSGPKREHLESLVEKMKLKDIIAFTGEIAATELIALYSRADVFVLPSIVDSRGDTEGLGVVVLEAMASGKPVVATKVGGIPEAVIHRKTGLLVEQGDSIALAKAIEEILSNKELRIVLGKNGKEWVKETFDWRVIAREFSKITRNSLTRILVQGESNVGRYDPEVLGARLRATFCERIDRLES